jgi:serine phosphatase RsbU (regulator of sigma subunit)
MTYGWRAWHDAVREALIAALLGMLATILDSTVVSDPPEMFVRDALTGICILLGARGLETALSWAIEQSRIPVLFRIVLYLLGGWIGFLIAVALVGKRLGPPALVVRFDSVLVLVLLALLIGFVLHHNRKRSASLRASIERLKEHEFAEKELGIARDMQQRLLPPPLIERDGFRVTARTHAAHMVGGDFYDVLRISDAQSAVLAADVSGKGIAASLIMASCKAMIPFLATGTTAGLMSALNARLCEQLQRREFVAMVFVRFEPATGNAEIVNAGMPDPLIVAANGARPVICSGDRLPLGAMRGARYESTTIMLEAGERLLLLSDGLPEATVDGSPIGYDRIEQIAAQSPSVDALVESVRAIPGIQVEDDLTVVAVEMVARNL